MTQEERWILEKYNGEKTSGFFADLERLQDGEPLAFILGHIPFLSADISLDSRPLIPRVETEFWVSKAIEEMRTYETSPLRILDLCSGSGCIGIAAAKALPLSTVHFGEIDKVHHATIIKNIASNGIDASRTRVFGGSLFENAEPFYDFILCNPPYIANGSAHVAESVKRFEPEIALYGGQDGLDLIRTIVNEAKKQLSKNGVLYIEHEPEQSEALQAFASGAGLAVTTHNDQYDVPRYSRFAVAQ
jgi:release factor glutamine methyltransferase